MGKYADDLIATWSKIPARPEFVLAEDGGADPGFFHDNRVIRSSADEWSRHGSYFCMADEDRSKIHVNLFPEPYAGDIRNAPVVILLKNPGFGDHVYREHLDPTYLTVMRRNIEQRFDDGEPRLFWFRPEFSHHGGYRYFQSLFAPVVSRFAQDAKTNASDALATLDRTICVVQMTGYTSGASPDGCEHLPSTQRVFAWLREEVLPAVRAGDRCLLIMRAVKEWKRGITDQSSWDSVARARGATSYFDEATRRPSFNPTKGAGKLVLDWMKQGPRS